MVSWVGLFFRLLFPCSLASLSIICASEALFFVFLTSKSPTDESTISIGAPPPIMCPPYKACTYFSNFLSCASFLVYFKSSFPVSVRSDACFPLKFVSAGCLAVRISAFILSEAFIRSPASCFFLLASCLLV